MSADRFREKVFDSGPDLMFDDLGGIVLGIVVWIGLIIAAPLVVLILAALLFSVELPIVIAIAVLLLVVRFTGITPWTVLTVNQVDGEESRETFRFLPSALKRIRETNQDRRIQVRWHWA